jgi:hypothetical protein
MIVDSFTGVFLMMVESRWYFIIGKMILDFGEVTLFTS